VKRAILSDIHGNLEALEAVLADIADQDVSEVICLGDIVGYGPNPLECIDHAMQFDFCILGNHDQGALFDPMGFSSGAEDAIFWTRLQLETGKPIGLGIIGPGAEPEHIPPRLEPHARNAVAAVASMLE